MDEHHADRPLRLLCVLSGIIGNRTYSDRLAEALDLIDGLAITYVFITAEDYRKYQSPRWARLSGPWEAEWLARRKVRDEAHGPFDLLMLNGWEFLVAFRELARQLPTAVVLDGVPSLMDSLVRQEHPIRGLERFSRWAANRIHHGAFAAIAGAADVYLSMSSWCAKGLQSAYRVAPDSCLVTLSPQDLEIWKPAARKDLSAKFRLLFVGNDFRRKGGEFLLRLYEAHLAEYCTLTIASNDPSLRDFAAPPGVQVLRGRNRDQLLEVYQSSDLFVFPTRSDTLGHVLGEALAVGLPCIATDVGGIGELVRNGETGYLMPYNAPMPDWAARIGVLAGDAGELARLSIRSRRFAENALGLPRFRALVREAIDRLRGQVEGGA